MTPEIRASRDAFRAQAHRVADWIADYFERVATLPVLSAAQPGELRRALPPEPPSAGEPFDAIFHDFERLVLPGVTHWQHPSFFAYFPANSSPPSVLAEMLTAALAVNGMNWITSPAATELETHVLEWLRQMCGLPAGWQGVIQDTASAASLCALLCARERATDDAANERGLAAAPPLTAYVSDQAHSSIEKGAKIAGYGRRQVRVIATDDAFAMDAAALQRAIAEDRAAGLTPAFVCATLGTTSSTAIDPLRRIGEVARRHGLWLHVDAALAGNAAILPEMRAMFDGAELADSWTFNPHKWLLTNFDCCVLYCADPLRLRRTFSIQPEYLRTSADDEVINYRDWGIPLGRRFRALKLWFVIRTYGVEGLRAYLRAHIRLAQQFAGWVAADPRFELLAPHPLNTICFRWVGEHDTHETLKARGAPDARDPARCDALNAANKRILDAVNATGRAFLTHTKLRDRFALRMAIGQTYTEEQHVRAAWELICTAAGAP